MNPKMFVVWSKEQDGSVELIEAYTSLKTAEQKVKELEKVEKDKNSFCFEYFVDSVSIIR